MATVKARNGAAVWREMEGQTVMLHLESSMYLGLNRTGSSLWPLIAEGTTVQALVDRLVQDYDVSAEQASSDVDAFLATCRGHDLLQS